MLVGKTAPFKLVLGENSSKPLTVDVADGAWVMKGTAGHMYELLLDTNTLDQWDAFVHPATQHLCWYPDAPQGDYSTLNGVPVTIRQGEHVASMRQQRLGLASTAQLVSDPFTACMMQADFADQQEAAAAVVSAAQEFVQQRQSAHAMAAHAQQLAAASSSHGAAGQSLPAAQQPATA